MSELTIFTPTYNRLEYLKKLCDSLLKQTCKDFIWLIVDDGSSDGTKEYIENIKNNVGFKIEYIYQKNSGKYVAHNIAVKSTKSEFFCCVDSDDILGVNAVNNILNELNDIKDNKSIIGVFFPRIKISEGNISFSNINNHLLDIMDLKFMYNETIETTIVIKTKILKNHLMTENEEKFKSEEILYIDLSTEGKFKFINLNDICFYEYLNDGLTKNIYSIWGRSPYNTMELLNDRYKFLDKYNFKIQILEKTKTIININFVCFIAKLNPFSYSPSKIMTLLLYIPSIVYKNIKMKG